MTEIRRFATFTKIAASIFALLSSCVVFALAAGSSAKGPKPDLHAGGASPSEIPNDAVTVVTLPGFHLTGAKIETGSICKVVSYQVVSDNEIKLNIKGTRTVDDKENQCTLKVVTPAGSSSTWIVVDLTDAQQQEVDARAKAEAEAKAAAFVKRAGTAWHMIFANGATETYTSAGANDDAMPTFHNSAGRDVKIAVSNDGTVMMIEPGCIRSGKLADNQVKNGQSQGECTPAGEWTATVAN